MTFDDYKPELVVNNSRLHANTKQSDRQKLKGQIEKLISKGLTLFDIAVDGDMLKKDVQEYLQKAEKNLIKAKEIACLDNDDYCLIHSYFGEVYFQMGMYEKALEHLKMLEDVYIDTEITEPNSIPPECKYNTFYNIGTTHYKMGACNKEELEQHLGEAKKYFLMAEELENVPEKIRNEYIAELYYQLGLIYYNEKTEEGLKSARKYFNKLVHMDSIYKKKAIQMLVKISLLLYSNDFLDKFESSTIIKLR